MSFLGLQSMADRWVSENLDGSEFYMDHILSWFFLSKKGQSNVSIHLFLSLLNGELHSLLTGC